jgi:hypothetical protein
MGSRSLLKRIAAWTLLVLAVTFVDGLRHTDDGCSVEIHCLACRTAHVPATISVVTTPVGGALLPTETLQAVAAPLLRTLFFPRHDSRGPPASA